MNIKKRHIGFIIEWMLIIGVLILTMSFVASRRDTLVCQDVKIHIKQNERNNLITKEEITDILHEDDTKIYGYALEDINTRKLEQKFEKISQIKKVEAYKQIDSSLHLAVIQRDPIVRVMNSEGESVYIDKEGVVMPVLRNHPSHVLVANGHLRYAMDRTVNTILGKDSSDITPEIRQLQEIYQMAVFVDNHDFWRQQIEQIYIKNNGEYEIIPRVGAHIITFGKWQNARWKFRKLKAFYEKGLNRMGWNQYNRINLKYKNQVICTKR